MKVSDTDTLKNKAQGEQKSFGGGRRFLHCRFLSCETKAGGDDGAGETPEQKAAREAAEADEKNKGHMVPLSKLNALKEKLDTALAELTTFKTTKQKEEETKLVEQGKLKEALELKEKEVSTLQSTIESLTGKFRQTQITTKIKEEIAKHNPKDVNDVFALIDMKKLDVEEDDDKNIVGIKGLDSILEDFKKNKDYLFGAKSTKNDTQKPGENGKPGAGDLATLEAEYRVLLEKPTRDMTLADNQRLRELTGKIKELRSKK